MNKQDRADLTKARAMIQHAQSIIGDTGEREQEKFDNMSEGLQQSENGQKLEENASGLDDLGSTLDDVLSSLDDLIG